MLTDLQGAYVCYDTESPRELSADIDHGVLGRDGLGVKEGICAVYGITEGRDLGLKAYPAGKSKRACVLRHRNGISCGVKLFVDDAVEKLGVVYKEAVV